MIAWIKRQLGVGKADEIVFLPTRGSYYEPSDWDPETDLHSLEAILMARRIMAGFDEPDGGYIGDWPGICFDTEPDQ